MKQNPGKSVFQSVLSVDIPLGELALYAVDASLDELLNLLKLESNYEVRISPLVKL